MVVAGEQEPTPGGEAMQQVARTGSGSGKKSLLVERASGTDEHYNSKERTHQAKRTNFGSNLEASIKQSEFSLPFPRIPSMYRGRVFIGDGPPTTLRYYTVMPPNNYIPGIF